MHQNNCQPVVTVWLTRLDEVDDTLCPSYRNLLDGGEQSRLDRFVASGAARQFLVARALLRSTLSRYRPVNPRGWTFESNYYGRPEISQPAYAKAISFNLSHTKGLVACAVSEQATVGVDVESLSRNLDYHGLAAHSFAKPEAQRLQRSDNGALIDHFFKIWTLKEAYIKARGMGLSIPLDSFWFDIDADPARIQFSDRCPDHAGHWSFLTCRPGECHRLALATYIGDGPPPRVDIRWTIPAPDTQLMSTTPHSQ